jgi:hypothetical protein
MQTGTKRKEKYEESKHDLPEKSKQNLSEAEQMESLYMTPMGELPCKY